MSWLQFHLLPIRDWNWYLLTEPRFDLELQFHLLPIRDWNIDGEDAYIVPANCNFTYSLLGIETMLFDYHHLI